MGRSRRFAAAALLSLCGCAPAGDPPGRSTTGAPPAPVLASPRETAPLEAEPPAPPASAEASGEQPRIASIAMRTYVYLEPNHRSTRLGYLRAGAVVGRAADPAGTEGCSGGWYRIEPRGYVCVGRGASLDLEHPVVLATARGPRRGEPLPYHYVISRKPPPTRYVRLPTLAEQRHVEGVGADVGLSSWSLRNKALLGPPDPPTPLLASGRDTPKPWGAEERMRFAVHRGRARGESAFGLSATFEWTGRRFGQTTELDIIPIDRTNVVAPSAMRGVEVGGLGVPAFVMFQGIGKMRPDDDGRLRADGIAAHRSGWMLTGKRTGPNGELVETTEGVWLPVDALRIGVLGKDLWGHAQAGKKWIDVSIERQMLVAYEGTRAVYATLVSTGRGGLDDPEITSATVQGTFFISDKHLSATMDGDEASDDAFDLHDVPYVQYFHGNYALHGAFWHDAFGKERSHGCINLAPADAAWLFEWTDPQVPAAWHGASNRKSGTLVYIHA
jgi:hypothetical protein